MSQAAAAPQAARPSAHWMRMVEPFKGADTRHSLAQLATTAVCFVGFWVGMYFSLRVHYLLTLALAVPTAGFLVRLFMIQHDCGHGSYFKSRKVQDAIGFVLGVVTLTPYQYWRKTHAYHHSHCGDLDFRGFGDILTMTLREYMEATPRKRFAYRLYRHPLILFFIGPAFHFLVKHRFPWDIPRDWKQAWASVWWTNLALACILLTATYTIGLGTFLAIQVPVTLLSCSLGVWLFYVQHQFEDTYWHHHEHWDYFDASVYGSSHLVLPRPLQWLTASIGLHHVHHLSSQIPNYRLEECLKANPELQQATKITMAQTWKLPSLTLWHEDERRLIAFREAKKLAEAKAA